MAFITHLDASAESNRRDSERRIVNMVFAALSGRGAPLTVVVHDISQTGFRAEFSSELQVGDEVRLRLGSAGYVPAEVVWRDGWDHGCRFGTPILPEEVRDALETLQPVTTAEEQAAEEATLTDADTAVADPAPASRRRKPRRIALLIVAAVLIVEAYFLVRALL